jgi:1-aminocyclopropane-1-carboxylate deaminase
VIGFDRKKPVLTLKLFLYFLITIPNIPLQEVPTLQSATANLRCFVFRDDLNHPVIQGNKLRKLMPHLLAAQANGAKGVLTFGGAFSNHLYAMAAAAQAFGLASVGIVRGTWADPDNQTLTAVRSMGMQLHFVSATDYALGSARSVVIQALIAQYNGYYMVPEGACDALGINGCVPLGHTLADLISANGWAAQQTHVLIGAGSCGTATGVLAGLQHSAKLHLIAPTHKGIDREVVYRNQDLAGLPRNEGFEIDYRYTFGGFGRRHADLDAWTKAWIAETGILPDPIYTCKVFYAAMQMMQHLPADSQVIAVHTGGLQGWNESNRAGVF